ncbi:MAG: type II toxin-antitoxin system RelE/ParE family toxin [Bacteroidia bacterium]
MERIVDVHSDVEKDIFEISDWYGEKNIELGLEFIDAWRNAYLKIGENPYLFAIKSKNTREVYLKKFPYVIFFEIKSDENIFIYSITHHKRLPEKRYSRKK